MQAGRVFPPSVIAPLRYSLRAVEKLFGVSRSTLYIHIAEDKLAVHKDGPRTFVSALEFAPYLEAQEAPGLDTGPTGRL